MSNLKNYLFTSESVSEGHPDKVSDRISDMVVDSYISGDPFSRVACETLTTTNKVVLAGEVRGPEINKDELIEKVCDLNKNTVVVLNTGSPCEMSWVDKANSILQCWFPGQEFGNSLSDVLFGEVNPSGKLPTTFPKNLSDTPAYSTYPGKDLQMDYEEGLFIGYRWYDREEIDPLFAFGHGLSYTTFDYSNLRAVPPKGTSSVAAFEVEITNSGSIAGKEIVQGYIKVPDSQIDRPVKELKKFEKVLLKPGESKKILFELSERDLSFWSETNQSWQVEPAEYVFEVGASAIDIRDSASVWLG